MKKIILLTIVFIGLSNVIFSQSKTLTREEATTILKDKFEYPNVLYTKWRFAELGNPYKDNLIPQGLVKSGEYGLSMGLYEFTDKGKQYIVDRPALIALGIRNHGEVTGIRTISEFKKIIEYTCVNSGLTPFGQFLKVPQTGKYTVEVELYDDGWRIVGDEKNYKPSDYPFFKAIMQGEVRRQEELRRLKERENAIREKHSQLAQSSEGYNKELFIDYGNTKTDGSSTEITWIFSPKCTSCSKEDSKIFLHVLRKSIINSNRKSTQLLRGSDKMITAEANLNDIRYEYNKENNKAKVIATIVFNILDYNKNTITTHNFKYQASGKNLSNEALFLELIEKLPRQINKDIFVLVPITVSVTRFGETNKKGNKINEVFIKANESLPLGTYNVIIFTENDIRRQGDLEIVTNTLAKGKIKISNQDQLGENEISVSLKNKKSEVKKAFDANTKLYGFITITPSVLGSLFK